MGIVLFHESVDLARQLLDSGERATADGLPRDEPEPALDLVDPRGVGGCVMHVVTGPAGQPRLHLGMLVGGVVVNDQIDVESDRCRATRARWRRCGAGRRGIPSVPS